MRCIIAFVRPNVTYGNIQDCMVKKRRDAMRINPKRFCITMAKQCLTTRDLQMIGGVSRSTIAKIKNDPEYEPTPKIIGKLAKALDVSVEYLTGTEGRNGL